MNKDWDCIVVGGGAAGLSAALVLGRSRRRTLLVDTGGQANLPAHGIGGLLGHDGRPPSELYEMGRRELAEYPSVEVRSDSVVTATAGSAGSTGETAGSAGTTGERRVSSAGTSYTLELASGATESTRCIILTTGMTYRRPEIAGVEELWGDSVFHCPFCHGWEARDGALAMLGKGDMGIHGALMLRGWSDDVVLLTDGPSELSDDHMSRLAAVGVEVEERELAGLHARDGRLAAIGFADGTQLERDGMMLAAQLQRTNDLPDQLGLELRDDSPMVTGAIKVDNVQETSVPGVFAAGDITGHSPNVVGAISSGSMAATGVVRTLLAEDVGLPIG